MKQKFLLKSLLLLCALVVGSSSVWADVSTLTPTSSTMAPSDDHFTVTYGGAGSSPAWQSGGGYVRLYAKNAITIASKNGETITQITFTGKVNANGKGVYPTSMSATGGSITPSTISATGSTDFSWTDATGVTSVTITIGGTAGNIDLTGGEYVVTYTPSAGGSDPSISLGTNVVNVTEAAVSTTSIDVTYNNLTNYDADVIFYEADGTTVATYDHSWITAEINATTKNLDYSITANTGAERTAYLRVYALGIEGEAQSSLITITQAKKSVAAPTTDLEGGNYLQGTAVNITSTGNTIYYTMTTDGSTPDNPTSSSTPYTAPIILGSGTTKIKAIAYDNYGNASSVITRTYTSITPVTLPFSWDGGGKAALTGLDGVFGTGLGSDYDTAHNPYLVKFDTEGDNIVIYTDGQPAKVTIGVKMIGGANTSKIKVQESSNGIEDFVDVEDLTISGSQGDIVNLETTKDFAATTRVIKLLFNKGSNVGVGPITISTVPVPVTITDAEYATYCNATKALDFSATGITVYTATDKETSVALNEVTTGQIPANTPVVLYKAGGGAAINVPVIASAEVPAGTNDLHVSTGTDVANMYVLSKLGGKVGFYPWGGTNLSAGKIYLQGKDSYGAREFIGFGDATGIDSVTRDALKNGKIYNLQGQEVKNATKGIFIVNGKKVFLK